MTTVKAPQGGATLPTPDHEFNWRQLAAVLLASKNITHGWWRVGMKLRFGALTTQMAELGQVAVSMPTALVGIESVQVYATTSGGELVFDAGKDCEPVPAGAVAPLTRKRRITVVRRKRQP